MRIEHSMQDEFAWRARRAVQSFYLCYCSPEILSRQSTRVAATFFCFSSIVEWQRQTASAHLLSTMFPQSNATLPAFCLPETEPHEVEKAPLDFDFVPNNYCVLCGKGKECYNYVGNRRFRVIVHMFLDRYSEALNKSQKSQIVSNVVDVVRDSGGAFLKLENGIWWEIGDTLAR